jgi:hypothetical protein
MDAACPDVASRVDTRNKLRTQYPMTFVVPKATMPAFDANILRAFKKAIEGVRSTGILAPVSPFSSDGGNIRFQSLAGFVLSQMRNGMTQHVITNDITHDEDSLILAGAAQTISRSIDYDPALHSTIVKMAAGQSSYHTHADLHILPGGVLVAWDTAGIDMLSIERNASAEPGVDAMTLFPSQATFELCFHAFIPQSTCPQDAQRFADYVKEIVPSLILRSVMNWDRPTGDLADRYRASTYDLA